MDTLNPRRVRSSHRSGLRDNGLTRAGLLLQMFMVSAISSAVYPGDLQRKNTWDGFQPLYLPSLLASIRLLLLVEVFI
jgi:hypothetical protein